ncbi:ATP-dependent DNA helicase RecQ-like [Branchiostoma floridae x Branchiostoma belcheri]
MYIILQIHRFQTVTGYKGIHLKNAADIRSFREIPDKDVRLVFMAPEELTSSEGRSLLDKPPLPIALVAVDEAHCIPQWGTDFRTAFKNIGSLRAALPGIPFMALTGTATAAVQKAVEKALHMSDIMDPNKVPTRIMGSLNRDNIFLVRKKVKSMKGLSYTNHYTNMVSKYISLKRNNQSYLL